MQLKSLLGILALLALITPTTQAQLNRSRVTDGNPGKIQSKERSDSFKQQRESVSWKQLFEIRETLLRERQKSDGRGIEASPNETSTFVVTNLNDSGPGSLRQAIAEAPGGGTITFASGLTGEILLANGSLVIDKSLSIVGPGARNIRVNAVNLSPGFASVFRIAPPELMSTVTDAESLLSVEKSHGMIPIMNVSISGLTIMGGRGTLAQSYQATVGGGIVADINPGSPTANLTVLNCSIQQNWSGLGGGIFLRGLSQTIIEGTTFHGNIGNVGGGLRIDETGPTIIFNSTFTNNISTIEGGAIFRLGLNSLAGVANSTISTNLTLGSAAGILSQSPPPPPIGASEGPQEDPEIGALLLLNTIVAGNQYIEDMISNPTGKVAYPDVEGVFAATFCLIGIGEGSNIVNGGAEPNIVGNFKTPIDPLLGSLADNGGPTDTMAISPMSLARDAGKNGVGLPPYDQRGFLRPWYPTLPNPFMGPGDGSDIGAYEYSFTTSAPVFLAGWVTDQSGRSVVGAQVTVMDSETGEIKTTRTNQFGRYSVEGLTAGRVFVVSVLSRFSSERPVQTVSLAEDLTGLNFVLSRR